MRKTTKKVTFQDPICMIKGSHACSNTPASCHGKRKTTSLKGEDVLTSSHSKTINNNQEVKVGSSIHSKTLPSPQVPNSPASKTIRHPTLANAPSPVLPSPFCTALRCSHPPVTFPHNVAQVQDIMVLKKAFPDSFDTIGNMPGTYTIRTDPSVPPAQHARQKVLIKYRDHIEKALDDMVLKGVIAPVTKPTTWVSSLTYPHKPDGSLHICLDPKDLNKAIVQEHYKAHTLDEITHHFKWSYMLQQVWCKRWLLEHPPRWGLITSDHF